MAMVQKKVLVKMTVIEKEWQLVDNLMLEYRLETTMVDLI